MGKYNVDIEYAYELSKRLGLEIQFDNDEPGVELPNGKLVSLVETFENMGYLSKQEEEEE